MLKKTFTITFIAAVLASGIAFAHPEFQSSDPSAGKAAVAPNEIRILFSEDVIARFSGAEIKDEKGKSIVLGKTTVDSTNKKVMIVPIKERMVPGDYTVEWHAVSGDTHKVRGNYSFSVIH